MNVYSSVSQLVGKTPLLKLCNIEKDENIEANLFAKLEFLNPAGSVKDRVAVKMLDDAEKSGKIKKGATIIEPTSGNTGIGLACICASRGYKALFVMPDSMSVERIRLLKAYGAEVVLTPGADGMQGSVNKACELEKEIEGSFVTGQFSNPSNALAHEMTTGVEILDDLDGNVDIFVAGVGTGGTITGVARALKSKNPSVKIVAVEPSDSPLLSKGTAGAHGIQGIGANFIPEILDVNLIDEIIPQSFEDSIKYAKMLAKREGVLVGISSGAAFSAAVSVAKRKENKDKNIVVLLADSASRYMSTPLFEE